MLYLPTHIPCASVLRSHGYGVTEVPLHHRQPGAIPVLLLNLMPEKAACELQIARQLVPISQEYDLQLIPVRIPGQTYKTTPMEHMLTLYEEIAPETFGSFPSESRLIVTGAPLENVPYADVRYWSQLCQIWEWASDERHVRSTLNLCWAAFAALWHHHAIPTHHLPFKRFGVYEYTAQDVPALAGMTPTFPLPTSRHIEIRREDVLNSPVQLVAESAESGPGILLDSERRMTHIVGHLEYEALRLHEEYERDLSRQLPIEPAEHYYLGTPAAEHVTYAWEQASLNFYRNFILSV